MVAILQPVGPGVQIPIDRAVVLIGRSPECDVVLDVSSRISRMHCALVQVDADYFIRDLGSMNGITVAGKRVEKDQKLTNGVEVVIGDLKFMFLENVAVAAKPGRPTTAGKPAPVLMEDSVEVMVVEDVEVVEPTAPRRPPAKATPSPFVYPTTARGPASGGDRMQNLNPDIIEDLKVVDAEIIEDVEVIDDIVDVIEVVEDVDVIDDIEVIEDVEIIDDTSRRHRPPRL